MIELNKENVCIGENSIAVFSQAYCETDIIVPDINPDIKKILQINSNAGISNKIPKDNRILIEGKTDTTVLYLGEDNQIYSISTSQTFSHTIDADGTEEGMFVDAEINADNTDFTVLNPRKLNVKTLMGIDANAVCDVNANICTGFNSDNSFEVLNSTVTPYKTACRTTEQICIKDKFELPGGKPSIQRILRMDSVIRDKEYTLLENKLMIKGKICVCVIYMGDTDGQIHTLEFETPFTEVIAMHGVDETMKPYVKLCISKLYYNTEADIDNDNRYIMMECIIGVNAKVCYGYSINVVRDAYCVKQPIKITKESANVSRLVSENKSSLSVKDAVVLNENMPEIFKIYNVSPHAFLGLAKIENKKAVIEGIIESDIMYISQDQNSPVNTYKHQQQFSHIIDIPQSGENMVCDVSLDITHSSYTISLGREIDLRFVMEISVVTTQTETVEYVSDAQIDENEKFEPKRSYCIKIYFVKTGDSLWSIAKNHCISRNSLMEINNISAENEIFDGRQIMIPIK